MNKSEMIALYDRDQRIVIEYPDMRREVTPHVVRHIDSSGFGEGMITYSRLEGADVEPVIREQVSFFEGIGQDFEWKVFDYDGPPDLKERLESHGFTIEEAEAIEVLDLEHAPGLFWQPVQHQVRRIVDPDQLADVQSVEQRAWDEDAAWVLDYLGDALRKYPERMSVYAAYVGQEPASAAWIFYPEHGQFASLWGGATVPKFRKQGLFTALLAARAQEAKARQVRFLTVDAMPMSRPILEKLGFEMMAWSYPCKWRLKA